MKPARVSSQKGASVVALARPAEGGGPDRRERVVIGYGAGRGGGGAGVLGGRGKWVKSRIEYS